REHAEKTADPADRDGLGQELDEDVAAARADRATDADLAGALEDVGEHDVHDPDPADEERDARDPSHDDVEDLPRPLALGEQLLGDDDGAVPARGDDVAGDRRGEVPAPRRAAPRGAGRRAASRTRSTRPRRPGGRPRPAR